MSVFCSNSLIFDPKCWKYILGGLDFKIFPGGGYPRPPTNSRLFRSPSTPKLLPPMYNLIETPDSVNKM